MTSELIYLFILFENKRMIQEATMKLIEVPINTLVE